MEYNTVFTDEAIKDMDGLDKKELSRIIKKLKWFAKQENPLNFAKRLQYDAIGQYRFRIGDYRVIFDCEEKNIRILRVGHRSSIYK
ncbi:MAG: type II toxin-antitoxin system RelE/ParE family toxin [Candidatus Magasanikbacteria bacterium]|nr:type II toxin-antitoxin system RelE/ParE family toxin [Candidatus Magasanikbacteria bacterium]